MKGEDSKWDGKKKKKLNGVKQPKYNNHINIYVYINVQTAFIVQMRVVGHTRYDI